MLPSKQTIHLARFHAEPLPGNPYHAQQVFGAWIVYYALAPDSEAFAQKIKNFLAQEKWKLIQLAESGTTSRERLASKPLVLQALEKQGDFAMIHASRFSSD
jgi:hypothetical protein